MSIPNYEIENWLDSTTENTEMRSIRNTQLEKAEDELIRRGYKINNIIGFGAWSIVLKGEVEEPNIIRNRYFEELSMDNPEQDRGYNIVNLISRAVVVGSYYINEKNKNIVKDPNKGERFNSVKSAENFLMTRCNRHDLENILNQLASKGFPRKGQMVAIKLSLNPGDDRFRREKRVAPLSLLKEEGGENVVSYYEYGRFDEYRYHATEYVMNRFSLRNLPNLEQKLMAFMEALRGVRFIHKYGSIVHRDLKPENIIVTMKPNDAYREYTATQLKYNKCLSDYGKLMKRGIQMEQRGQIRTSTYQRVVAEQQKRVGEAQKLGRRMAQLADRLEVNGVKITDFGLAKFKKGELKISSWSMKTREGTTLGTPFYMPPEQVGSANQTSPSTDHRSDIYSMGAILYEILTGIAPYKNMENDLNIFGFIDYCIKVAANPDLKPTHPKRVNKYADPYLIKICSKAMHRDMDKRYDDIDEMIGDMEDWCIYQNKSRFGKYIDKLKQTVFGTRIISGKDLSGQVFE